MRQQMPLRLIKLKIAKIKYQYSNKMQIKRKYKFKTLMELAKIIRIGNKNISSNLKRNKIEWKYKIKMVRRNNNRSNMTWNNSNRKTNSRTNNILKRKNYKNNNQHLPDINDSS